MNIAVYARVSTHEQDPQRQIDELHDFVEQNYPEASTHEYVDIISGGMEGGGEEYRRLREDISSSEIDLVVVHELSRLSRLGGGEIHEFIQHALDHDTSVRDLEVGLSINVDDSMVDRAVTEMIANIMGDLARIEQKQKVRRIRSGIEAAQQAGKWTGRPPRGFTIEDGYLRVDPEEYLRVRSALERIATGEASTTVAEDVGIPDSTLRKLLNERSELYLSATAVDDRVDAALEEMRPIDDLHEEQDDLEDTVREIVRNELDEREVVGSN